MKSQEEEVKARSSSRCSPAVVSDVVVLTKLSQRRRLKLHVLLQL